MVRQVIKKAVRRGLGVVAPAVWRLRPKPSLVILTYHRVLPKYHPDRQFEQPGMYVSPEALEMHVRVLKKHFEIVDLGEWVGLSKTGQPLPDRACAITFDDGWRDNYEYAFQVLQREQVPATIFLVADLIGCTYEFWPNRLARLMLRFADRPDELPQRLKDLLASAGLYPGRVEANISIETVDKAIQWCKSYSDVQMVDMLDEAARHVGWRESVRTLLNLDEIYEMRASGLVRYGSHGKRHTRLVGSLDPRLLMDEVMGSRDLLRTLLGDPVGLFCYPNGDWSPDALEVVRMNYSAAVATSPGWNFPETDGHLLHRISVHEDVASDAFTFLSRVSGLA